MPEINKKKKILWISDDIRMQSGVATSARQLILETVHKYDYFCLGGAITHPEKGKVFDLSQSTNEMAKIKDASVKIMPVDGYGNEQILFQVMAMEKPDAIAFQTDPRFWPWLWALEKQIRSTIPLCYWALWDACPNPMYNRPFYESNDAIFAISKQSNNIHKWALGGDKNCCYLTDNEPMNGRTLLHLVPHGIDGDLFHPIPSNNPQLVEFKRKMFSGKDFDFAILYNSRNIQRKRTSNIILAFRQFCDNLPKEKAAKCVLILHTEIMQDAGTNLVAVKEALCPDYNIIFSPGKFSPVDMCLLYNVADVTVNASSSEGFGLSTAESIMCGTPVSIAVTGGLQDQTGQLDDNGNPVEFDADFGSNSNGRYKKHGPWAYPVWPVSRLIQGSIPTPYIMDDITKWEDFGDGFMYWHLMGNKKREKCGEIGRQWALNEGGINSKNMGKQFIDGMEHVFKHWSPPKKFGVYSIKDYVGNTMTDGHMGFEIPKIDKDILQERISNLGI